jgi:hypothetical protein
MFVIIVDGDERIRESLTELLEAHGKHSPWPGGLGRALGVTRRVSKGSCWIASFMELSSRSEGTSLIAGRLLPTRVPSEIARRFACQSPERRGKCRL